MKVFISQPFQGRTEKEIFDEREQIITNLKKYIPEKEFDVIDQYHQTAPEGAVKLYYLSQDLLMMCEADLIVFAHDWKRARGCRIENKVATEYGMNIWYD